MLIQIENFYTALYFIYFIFAYNIWSKIYRQKSIDYINNNIITSAYWLPKIQQLSQNSLLFPTYYIYISLVFVHCVILFVYYLKWSFHEPICYMRHILSTIPVCLQIFNIDTQNIDYTTLMVIFNILVIYYFTQNMIYIQ